jgi:hypothetical protein
MSIRQILFGTGWWTVWHGGLWLMLLPCAVLVWWLINFKPDGGPQGGELAAGMVLLFLLVWTVATLVHALLFASLQPGGVGRYLKYAALWLPIWWFIGWAIYRLTNLAASTSADLMSRRMGLVGFIATVVALYAANLWILARFQSR